MAWRATATAALALLIAGCFGSEEPSAHPPAPPGFYGVSGWNTEEVDFERMAERRRRRLPGGLPRRAGATGARRAPRLDVLRPARRAHGDERDRHAPDRLRGAPLALGGALRDAGSRSDRSARVARRPRRVRRALRARRRVLGAAPGGAGEPDCRLADLERAELDHLVGPQARPARVRHPAAPLGADHRGRRPHGTRPDRGDRRAADQPGGDQGPALPPGAVREPEGPGGDRRGRLPPLRAETRRACAGSC